MIAVCAGVVMNVVLAAFILWGVYATRGVPSLPDPVGTQIDRPVQGYPAGKAGLIKGDEIIAFDGVPVTGWEDLVAVIYKRPAKEVRVDFLRDGVEQNVILTTRSEKQTGEEESIGKIGIGPMLIYERLGVGTAFAYGTITLYGRAFQTVLLTGRFVTPM